MSTDCAQLKEAILAGNKDNVLTMLVQMKEDCLVIENVELVQDVTSPAIISELHGLLIEHLGANNRNMLVKGRVPNIRKRAYCFVQAMENGVKRLP